MFGAAHYSVDFIHNGIEAVAGLCQSMVSLRFSYVHRLVLVSTQEVRINPINKQEQMKKLLLFLMLLSATNAFAQDVIVKKDGSTIVSKVIEITSTEVKYKKFSNLNGPTYTIAKNELQAINYENGENETFGEVNPIQVLSQGSEQQIVEIQSTNSINATSTSDEDLIKMANVSLGDLQKAKRLRISGIAIGGTAIIVGIAYLINSTRYNDDNAKQNECYLIGGCCIAGGIVFTIPFLIRAHILQKRYNSVYNVSLYRHKVTFKNGTSFAAGVDLLRDNRIHNQTIGLGFNYNF